MQIIANNSAQILLEKKYRARLDLDDWFAYRHYNTLSIMAVNPLLLFSVNTISDLDQRNICS